MTDLRQRRAVRPYLIVGRLLDDPRVRYLFAGGLAAVVYYAVFSGGWLLSGGRLPYLAMAVVANLVTAVTTFPVYRHVVFRASGPWLPAFLRFYVICFWSLVFTLGGLPLLVEVGNVAVLPAQAVLIVVSPLINYQVNRLWAFRRQ